MAIATLTYNYADSTAVLGPLASYAEPHCYDLCRSHSQNLTAPRGWQIVRLTKNSELEAQPENPLPDATNQRVQETGNLTPIPEQEPVAETTTPYSILTAVKLAEEQLRNSLSSSGVVSEEERIAEEELLAVANVLKAGLPEAEVVAENEQAASENGGKFPAKAIENEALAEGTAQPPRLRVLKGGG